MPLVLGDLDSHGRQLGNLMPGGRRVVGLGLLGQRAVALGAALGDERHDGANTFGRQALFQMGRMSVLSPGFAASRFLGRRRRQVRLGTWRSGRLEFVEQVAQLPFEFENLGLQLGYTRLQRSTTGTLGDIHASSIKAQAPFSCASL
jgi:hypothetical protein